MVAFQLAALRPNVLCIVPPYATDCPPAGAAALLGHLKHHGCHEFDFVDLRLWALPGYAPTYRNIGADAENFVIDVPRLARRRCPPGPVTPPTWRNRIEPSLWANFGPS